MMQYSKEQIMLSFSYMAYYGFALDGDDDPNELAIANDIQKALKTWKAVNNQWELVWGPSVLSFPGDKYNDNMMFVVRHTEDPSQYVIAIRGTNPISLNDWLIEDFKVLKMVKWSYGNAPKRAMISKSTDIALNRLQGMRVLAGVPGAGKTLLEFMQGELKNNPAASICVTGHSLGGALAPTFALWLKDIQAEQLSADAHISTVAFAGPTAGNQDFADYSDQRFGADCVRVANSLDVVPYAWNSKSLTRLYTLYRSHLLFPGPLLFAVFGLMLTLSLRGKYQQIKEDTPALPGKFKPLLYNYFAQGLYQHVIGYPEILGLLKNNAIPVAELFLGLEMVLPH